MGECPTEAESEEFAMDLKRERDLSSEIAQRTIAAMKDLPTPFEGILH